MSIFGHKVSQTRHQSPIMFSGSPDNCPQVLSPSLCPFDLQMVPNTHMPGHLQVCPPLLFHGLTPHPHLPFIPQTGLQCSQCQSHHILKVAKHQSNEIIDFDSISSTIATSYLINIHCFYQVTVFFLLLRRYTMWTSADRTTNMLWAWADSCMLVCFCPLLSSYSSFLPLVHPPLQPSTAATRCLWSMLLPPSPLLSFATARWRWCHFKLCTQCHHHLPCLHLWDRGGELQHSLAMLPPPSPATPSPAPLSHLTERRWWLLNLRIWLCDLHKVTHQWNQHVAANFRGTS